MTSPWIRRFPQTAPARRSRSIRWPIARIASVRLVGRSDTRTAWAVAEWRITDRSNAISANRSFGRTSGRNDKGAPTSGSAPADDRSSEVRPRGRKDGERGVGKASATVATGSKPGSDGSVNESETCRTSACACCPARFASARTAASLSSLDVDLCADETSPTSIANCSVSEPVIASRPMGLAAGRELLAMPLTSLPSNGRAMGRNGSAWAVKAKPMSRSARDPALMMCARSWERQCPALLRRCPGG